jgi:4-carboxymuconolactone decarboxylase
VQHALAAGLSHALVDGIAAGKADALPHPYDLVQEILAQTTTWQVVPDELQARAVAQWGREGLVEIVVVSGFYQMFAAINQRFDIHPPG